MLNPFQWIAWFFQIGFVLVFFGGLAEVTLMLARDGAKAQQRGPMSLTALNRSLGLKK